MVNKLNVIKKIWVLQNFKSQTRLSLFLAVVLSLHFYVKVSVCMSPHWGLQMMPVSLCGSACSIPGKLNSTLSRLDIPAALLGSKVDQTGLFLMLSFMLQVSITVWSNWFSFSRAEDSAVPPTEVRNRLSEPKFPKYLRRQHSLLLWQKVVYLAKAESR